MRELIGFLVFMTAIFALTCAPAAGLVYALLTWECSTYEQATGKPTKVAAFTCYVQQDGVWMHWEEYKLRFATQGAK